MYLTDDQFSKVMREIDSRRFAAERDLKRRTDEVFAKLPALAELKKNVAKAGAEASKRFISGDTGARAEYDAFRKDAEEKRASLLKEGGFPEDYLSPHYFCPICGDTGRTEDGELCECFRQAAYDLVFSTGRLKELLEGHTFADFDLSLYPGDRKGSGTDISCRGNAVRAVDMALRFVYARTGEKISVKGCDTAAEGGKVPSNLVIYGPTGTGKTFLSLCIAGEILKSRKTVVYLTAAEFVEAAEAAEFKKDRSRYEGAVSSELLIIDDLGTEFLTPFALQAIYRAVNERILNSLPVIISTNLTPNDLRNTYSDRIFSRLMGNYYFIKLDGTDFRTYKKG